ncbi:MULTISPECIES: GIY-YIG nuclease family protein [unclassified Kitasatospora]|uniref:GIY-YIG nuclease family protein n=1 Tax=unclassified Kitasatospora TaxID=2633591 RepID=UPI00340F9294
MAQSAEEFVYLITATGARTAKIGRSTDPGSRLAALQAGSPVALLLAATSPGGPRLERYLHKAFDGYRIHREWFDFGDRDPLTEVTVVVEAYEPEPGHEDRAGRFRDVGPPLHTLALTGGEPRSTGYASTAERRQRSGLPPTRWRLRSSPASRPSRLPSPAWSG